MRERFQRLFGPVALLFDAPAGVCRRELPLRDVDPLRPERVQQAFGRVGHRLVGPHLRQRIDAAAQVLGEPVQLLLEIAVLLAAATGERGQRRHHECLFHFLPPFFAAAAALRCCATSWSSR